MNKYRFRNVVLEEKPKTMDNVLSSIHFYLPHRRQQHLLKFRSLCFSQSACPKPKDARLDCGWLSCRQYSSCYSLLLTRQMYDCCLLKCMTVVFSNVWLLSSQMYDCCLLKCMTVVFSNDSFLSSLLISLAYKYLFPKLEVHLVRVTSLILRWLVTYHKILYCLTRPHFPKLWTFTLSWCGW